ncbi:MAG: aminotransferase class I/II-fold pyridoxal phosphate-dependent enzyme [Planctomycetes bacterium]|nr:aminotransferase class I/II-fold pyridoxal phosphate-dependent enzyme [Planctomycetota bacterium]
MHSPRIFLSPPHLSGQEQANLAEVLASNWVAPAGPQLDQLEKALAARLLMKHAAAVSSGTAALHLALRHLNLAPGDEVICSTLTFCASANPIVYEGATPVFIDSDRSTWNMDPNLLEEELRACASRHKLPRAIVVVDIFGQSADLDAINAIAAKYAIPVIEDAAEALGATYKGRPAGSAAWASIVSFNGNKIITAGGGGAIVSNDEQLIERSRFFATQARDPAPHYEHSSVGYNYRMSNVLAAIGLAQLDVLDDRVASRRRNFEFYQQHLGELPGVSFMPEARYGMCNRWLTVMQVDPSQFGATHEAIRLRLEQQNIESRPVWKPLHLQPVFSHCRCRGGHIAESLFASGLCLPSGSALTECELTKVCEIVESVQSNQELASCAA